MALAAPPEIAPGGAIAYNPPATVSMVGRMIDARWRVVEELGPTAHGTAFRVEEEQGPPARLELWDERHVAERGRLAQLERQARIISRLQHPRCLALRHFGVEDGRPFVVTELAGGKPLADQMGTEELTVPRAIAIALQVLEGLRYLHAHGVVHREIGPQTVWLGTSLTGEAVSLGPPQLTTASGDRADSRGDLYAAGLLLYTMCVGRAAPAAGVPGAVYPTPRSLAPDRGISEAAERVMMRAIAPSRDARFQTAEDFIVALQRMDRGEPRATRPAAPPPPRRPPRPALLLGGVALLALGALGAVLLRRGRPTPVAHQTRPAPPPSEVSAPPPVVVSAPPVTKPAPPPPVVVSAPPAATPAPPPPVVHVPPPPAPRQPPPAAASPEPAAAPPASGGVPSASVRAEIWRLLERRELDAAQARISPLVVEHPEAPWPHLARAELFLQRRWRRDSVREWLLALERDPALAHAAHLRDRLCWMLDEKWEAAGVGELIARLGKQAAPILRQCVATAETPALRAQATRALARAR